MKTKSYLLAAAAIMLSVAACKTNEENYRKAYEKAKEAESAELESTIYGRYRNEAKDDLYTIGADTVNIRREFVTVSKDQAGIDNSALKRYSVVVAQFKQLFHAKSLCGRYRNAGYESAFVVETREPLYYVVAASSSEVTAARDIMLAIEAAPPVALQANMPFLLRSNR